MRTFIALDLPPPLIPPLQKLQHAFAPFGSLTFVRGSFHSTLKFLGELSREELKQATAALATISSPPFQITLARLGVFPSERLARVLWVGLAGPVLDLQHKVEEALLPWFPRDPTFQAHVTLARIRSLQDKDGFLDALHHLSVPSLGGTISSFRLYTSCLSPEGPSYTPLKEYPLGGAPQGTLPR